MDLPCAPVDPGTDAVGAHRQGPVPMGLEAVVPAAEAGQVAQDRQADREGNHMVEVAERAAVMHPGKRQCRSRLRTVRARCRPGW